MSPKLNLNYTDFQSLFTADGLSRLDNRFIKRLREDDTNLADVLLAFRQGAEMSATAHSQLLLDMAPYLDAFLSEMFNIEDAALALTLQVQSQDPIFIFKNYYVLRQAKRLHKKLEELPTFDCLNKWLSSTVKAKDDWELAVAQYGASLLEQQAQTLQEQEKLAAWCARALTDPQGIATVNNWTSFTLPKKLHFENLVDVQAVPDDTVGRLQGPPETFRERDGFRLTDLRMSRREVLGEINYCVYCHKTDGDFCSKGFPVKKNDPAMGLKINPVGETLTGCPLEEKISEMHTLKKNGLNLAALAVIMIDNPMCPATGHRICNDCMKGCIFQKQEPVNIPQVETRVLTDVLGLPWGVELYDLLTRWNPLRRDQFVMKPYNGLKVLVMGMGPAGFTMAHHLLMEGYAVVGTDGLKIEPLPQELVSQPIYDYHTLEENLDERVMSGFGGVAEYGITVRWDKNFLKLIYISLLRKKYFQVFGNVRFGGTLTVDDAWRLGFDHMTLAVGAGLPRELSIPNSLAPGMRQANDFLMALQLTGAAKESSLANLQVRLPAVVIGGGLTGVDTATEVQAYYIKQVEKVLKRYEVLCDINSVDVVRSAYSVSDLQILDEFISHGKVVREERVKAQQEKREPRFLNLIRKWGGVTIVYRRSMQESPAYKRNHEELAKALEEGIYYAEGLSPLEVVLDAQGNCQSLLCQTHIQDEEGVWMDADESYLIPARAIFVATGAKPNVAYAFEHAKDIKREKFEYPRFSQRHGVLSRVVEHSHVKMPEFGAFTSYQQGHRFVSFIGDTHPVFHGSVVKAIASAKRSYPKIVEALNEHHSRGDDAEYQEFRQQIEHLFSAQVVAVKRILEDVVELTVHAPQAAANFNPGQFYRVQNFERDARFIDNTALQTEALALMGYQRDIPDQLSFLVVERGASSRLVNSFEKGQRLAVMGPTGVRTKIPDQPETIMIIGGVYAASYLLSVAPALRKAHCKILFVGYFPDGNIPMQHELQNNCDVAVWVTDENELITRLRAYAQDQESSIALQAVDRVDVIGYASLLRIMQKARGGLLKEYFKSDCKFQASVFGPMQCMLKGVCAQCLQWQIDPATGKRTKAVYACSWQNQPMDIIDIGNLDERLSQNSVQETLSNQWLSHLIKQKVESGSH